MAEVNAIREVRFFPLKLIFTGDNIRTIATTLTPVMDVSVFTRVHIKVRSTLDQAIVLQLIGDFVNPMDVPTEIDGLFAVAAGNVNPSSTEIGLADDDWQPFLALQIITAIAPTAGVVNVWLQGQG